MSTSQVRVHKKLLSAIDKREREDVRYWLDSRPLRIRLTSNDKRLLRQLIVGEGYPWLLAKLSRMKYDTTISALRKFEANGLVKSRLAGRRRIHALKPFVQAWLRKDFNRACLAIEKALVKKKIDPATDTLAFLKSQYRSVRSS